MERSNKSGRRPALKFVPLVFVMLVGVALSIAGYIFIDRQEERRVRTEFEEISAAYQNILQDSLTDAAEHLASVADLFAASGDVTSQEFRSFTRPILEHHPGVWALSWFPRIKADEREAFEAFARAEIFPKFIIRELDTSGNMVPSPERDEYFPTLYYEPVDPSERPSAFGFDPMPNATRRQAFVAARDTGDQYGTPRIKLVTVASDQFAIAVVQAIYRNGQATDTVEERRSALKGFITGIFQVGALVESALANLSSDGLNIYFHDVTGGSGPDFLYYHASRTVAEDGAFLADDALRTGTHIVLPLEVGNRSLTALFRPAPGFFVNNPLQAFLTLLGGLVLTGALALYQYSVLVQNVRVSRFVAKRTEALATTKKRLSGILEIASDAIISADDSGRIIMFNQGAQNTFGYTPEAAIGQPLEMLLPESYRGHHRELVTGFGRSSEASRTLTQRTGVWGLKKDGTEFPAEASISKLEVGGQRIFTATIRDVTDRKLAEEELLESENRMRTLANASPSLISYVGADRVYRFVNKTYADWYGKSADEIVGSSVQELHGEAEYEHLKPNLDLVLSGQDVSFEADLEDVVLGPRSVQGTLVPDFDQHRNVVGYFVYTNDVTEIKAREAQLFQAQKMDAVGQLTGGVAHDFNNLLAVIMGNVELARARLTGNDDTVELLDRVCTAAERGADLTQRLLAFSRQQVLAPTTIDLNKVATGMVDLLGQTLGEQIEISSKLTPDLWLCSADPAQFENAILNLALNARDAMPDGGYLNLETSNMLLNDDVAAAQLELETGEYVVLSVTDNGEGIAKEYLEHIFEPFFTTKTVEDGSGLGLSMVFGFVKQSGGHMTVYSKVGEGTTFRIYLPRVSGQLESVMEPKSTSGDARIRGATILVVEDDPDVRALAVALLDNMGCKVMEAPSGPTALELLANKDCHIDLLLTDVVLPGGMTGPALAARVQEERPEMPVLFMSGYAEQGMSDTSKLKHGDAFLQKPFRKRDLVEKLGRALRNSQFREQETDRS